MTRAVLLSIRICICIAINAGFAEVSARASIPHQIQEYTPTSHPADDQLLMHSQLRGGGRRRDSGVRAQAIPTYPNLTPFTPTPTRTPSATSTPTVTSTPSATTTPTASATPTASDTATRSATQHALRRKLAPILVLRPRLPPRTHSACTTHHSNPVRPSGRRARSPATASSSVSPRLPAAAIGWRHSAMVIVKQLLLVSASMSCPRRRN